MLPGCCHCGNKQVRILSFMGGSEKAVQCKRCRAVGPVGKDLEDALDQWASRADSGVGELKIDSEIGTEMFPGRKLKDIGADRLKVHPWERTRRK